MKPTDEKRNYCVAVYRCDADNQEECIHYKTKDGFHCEHYHWSDFARENMCTCDEAREDAEVEE